MTADHLGSAIDKLRGVELTVEEWQAVAAEIDRRLDGVEGYAAKPGSKGVVIWENEFNFINSETLKSPSGPAKPFISPAAGG